MRLPTLALATAMLLLASGLSLAMQRTPVAQAPGGGLEAPMTPALGSRQNSGLTLDQAVQQVRAQYNGRIVSAETKISGGRETHIIKVLTSDGKVKTVTVPGRRV
jgi:hypothetical protein